MERGKVSRCSFQASGYARLAMKSLLLVPAVVLAFTSGLRADDHKLTAENTTVKFVGSKKDGKHEGTFKKLDGTLSLDAADVTKSKLEVSIDIASITTDAEKLTNHLKGPDFFDAGRFPTAKFVSTGIQQDKEKKDTYIVTGDLTMHGKTKAVTFPATAVSADSTTTVSGKFEINRHDWGISYSKGTINDAVQLSIEVKLKTKAK